MQYGTVIIKNSIENAKNALSEYKNSVIESGNIFVLVRNEYDANYDIKNDFFDVIEYGEQNSYSYVNTVVVPTRNRIEAELPDNVLYIVWFAKDRKKQFFNKDAIRESHIWKDVEWGKREKNYNPKGKDPGNVWIPTKDDGKGRITEHILMELSDIVQRLFIAAHQQSQITLFVSDVVENKKNCNENMQFVHIPKNEQNYSQVKPQMQSLKESETAYQRKLFAKIVWETSENMSEIANGTVDLVVTSPPYWDLKDYFKEGQIGQETYCEYLARMYKVWNECYKKLTQNGSMWVNINIRVKNNKPILLPKDFIKQCKKIGFYYKGVLIWHKSSGIPTNDKNIVDRHEYVLVFSKSKGLILNDKIYSFSDYKNEAINGGLFWNINRKAGSVGKHFIHPAIYPNDLVTRIVETSTNKQQNVLDPFLGSGTTLIASVLAERNCYGYEYNEGFKSLITDRIQNEIGLMSNCNIKL
jgi:DNA modification methylase